MRAKNIVRKTITVLFFLVAVSIYANGTAGAHLNLMPWARDAAMGDMGFALPPVDASAVFTNPSGLAFLRTKGISASYIDWFSDSKLSYISAYKNNPESGFALGFGGLFFDVPEWDNTWWMEPTEAQAPAKATDYAFRLALAQSITKSENLKFSVGLSADALMSNISDHNAFGLGIGANIGIIYKYRLYGNFGFDRFTIVKPEYNSKGENLPQNLKAGFSWILNPKSTGFISPFVFTAGVRMPTYENNPIFGAGIESNFFNTLYLRAGYNTQEAAHNASFGVGTRFAFNKDNLFRLDYSYSPYNYDMEYQDMASHRITLSWYNSKLARFNLKSPPNKTVFRTSMFDTLDVDVCWESSPRWNNNTRYAYRIIASYSKRFNPDRTVIDTVVYEDSLIAEDGVIPPYFCMKMPPFTSSKYDTTIYWKVYRKGGGEADEYAHNCSFNYSRSDTFGDSCPFVIMPIDIENEVVSVKKITDYYTQTPAFPIIFFDQGESKIESPLEHRGITDPNWAPSGINCFDDCLAAIPENFYEQLFSEIAKNLRSNPDVSIELFGYANKRNTKLVTDRMDNVRKALIANGAPPDRVFLADTKDYDITSPRATFYDIHSVREKNAIMDENSRVEIKAQSNVTKYYKTIGEELNFDDKSLAPVTSVDESILMRIASDKELISLLKSNPDVRWVVQLKINPDLTNPEFADSTTRNFLTMDFGYATAFKYRDQLIKLTGLPDDKIQAWVLIDNDLETNFEVDFFPTADEVVFTPIKYRKVLIDDSDMNEINSHPVLVMPDVSFPCLDSENRMHGYQIRIINDDGDHIRELASGKSKIPQEILTNGINWDWRDDDGELVPYRDKYWTELIVEDEISGIISAKAGPIYIEPKRSEKQEFVLISLHEYDNTMPLSMTMRNRALPATGDFIHDKKYQWDNRRNMWVNAQYNFVGRACVLGSRAYNQELSSKRSHEEMENFRRIIRFTPDYVDILSKLWGNSWYDDLSAELADTGTGEINPLADNRIPEGRLLNRSVYLKMDFYEERMTPNHIAMNMMAEADSLLMYERDKKGALALVDSARILAEDKLLRYNLELRNVRLIMVNDDPKDDTLAIAIVKNIENEIDSTDKKREHFVVMAKLLAEIGETEKAIDYLEEYIGKFPDDGIPYYEYAEFLLQIFLKTNNHSYLKNAQEKYEMAIEKQPDLMKARLRLLAIRLLADDPDPKAVQELLNK